MSLITPHKFRFLPKHFKTKPFNLLDVGAGSHSATKTKKAYPLCNYYGIDITKSYENDEADLLLSENGIERVFVEQEVYVA